jgi:hypothetical protein
MKRATFLRFAVGVACAAAVPLLHAQSYPGKPVRLLAPGRSATCRWSC